MIKGWIQKDDPSSINFLEIFLGKGKVGTWEIPVAVLEMGEVEEIDIFLDSLTRLDNKASLPQLRNYIISIKNDAIRLKAILEGKEGT